MTEAYDLTKLDSNSFEHLVNALALRVLGAGHTSFSPGPDGGRDGWFEGEAPYPSTENCWTGRWYIQSKFHKPHLSTNAQKWLLDQIKSELKEFANPTKRRKWPDNWIVATNIDPSGVPETGAFDAARTALRRARSSLSRRFHIWGGSKIISLLSKYPDVRDQYYHFLTPGHVLISLREAITEDRATVDDMLRSLVIRQFKEQQFTKLEQAGSDADARPGIHQLFIDLPYQCTEFSVVGYVMQSLVEASARSHKIDPKMPLTPSWRSWNRHPTRSRTWFVRGGPGQGKSTIAQYFCQIQRAALILQDDLVITPALRNLAHEIQAAATKSSFWPAEPRIPIHIELKDYAHWLGGRKKLQPIGVLTYLAEKISADIEKIVSAATLRRALGVRSWVVVFDGLDEVPHDVKDTIAVELRHFVDEIATDSGSDLYALCTSRPQGYSGQLSDLEASELDLIFLTPEQALECAKPVAALGRTEAEAKKASQILTNAIKSASARELMKTPLQAHIMAVVVRDGGRPPDRKWQLYNNFYEVIRKREANRDLPDASLAALLREDEQLLRTIHNRLGFVLHTDAETSSGSQTSLPKNEFRRLAGQAVSQLVEEDIVATVETLMEASTDRLVLVSTPDDGEHLRFDIRPLQEFFAGEFIYESIDAGDLHKRFELIAGDAHWREVAHFLLSALAEKSRLTELVVAIEALDRLNNGDSDGNRLLHRRLARGAIMGARLLREGVLEQDKRLRQRFRACIEPLTALSELDELLVLTQVDQPNSRAWLIRVLIDRLRESDHRENLGACIALGYLVPDDSGLIGEIQSFILTAPSFYLEGLLAFFSPGGSPSVPLSSWVTRTVLMVLLSPRWKELDGKGIDDALSFLAQLPGDRLVKIVRQNPEWSTYEAGILELLEVTRRMGIREDEIDKKEYPGLILWFPKRDWTNNSPYVAKLASLDAEGAPGIMSYVIVLARFSVEKTKDNFVKFLRQDMLAPKNVRNAINNKKIDGLFPSFYPHSAEELLGQVEGMSESDFQDSLRSRKMGTIPLGRCLITAERTHKSEGGDNEGGDINSLFRRYPELFLSSSLDARSPSYGRLAQDSLLALCLEAPETLSGIPHVWGALIKAAGPLSEKLRKLLVAECKGRVPADTLLIRRRTAVPFKLKMTRDVPLMPFVVAAIFSHWNPEEQRYHRHHRSFPSRSEVQSIAPEFVADPKVFGQFARKADKKLLDRAAAGILYALHPDAGSQRFEHISEVVVQALEGDNPEWLIAGLSLSIYIYGSEGSAACRCLMNALLQSARANFRLLRYPYQVLRKWRETSEAPVSTKGYKSIWLQGRDAE